LKLTQYMTTFFILAYLCIGNVTAAEQTENEKLIAVQKITIVDRPLIMAGMGLTQLISDDYYIGAFYIDSAATYAEPDDLVYIDATRRMEFRFASKRKISARSFARKIAEGIRLNNSKANIDAEKDKLKKLMGMFKGNYKKGDILSFDYHQSFGLKVLLNGRTIGTIERSRDLYRLLVKIWVGDRPPSSKFKVGITGKNDNAYAIELLKRFIAL
jgi:hypothetical protein